MNTAQNKITKALTPSSSTSAFNKKAGGSKMPTIAGISILEVALMGAAGFVLWKNREKVKTILTDNGIEVPSFLSSDLNELIQSGVSLMGSKNASDRTTSGHRRTHDA